MKKLMIVGAALSMSLLSAQVCLAEVEGTVAGKILFPYVDNVTGERINDNAMVSVSGTVAVDSFYAMVEAVRIPDKSYVMGEDESYEQAGNEIDFYVGHAAKYGAFDVDLGVAYYNLEGNFDLWGVYAKIGHDFETEVGTFTPFIYGEADYDLDELEGGALWQVGVNYKLENFGLTVDVSGHDSLYGYEKDFISSGRVKAFYDFPLTETISLTPEITAQKHFGKDRSEGGIADDEVFGGLTLKAVF